MKEVDILKIFNKYAGKEIHVDVREEKSTYEGEVYTREIVDPIRNEPTLTAMEKLADRHGLKLRVWFPDTINTMEYRADRVNVRVSKSRDGKWRVGGISIG